jgi:hypothetical protein
MAVQTSDLDSSVARLLTLAAKIENHDVAPPLSTVVEERVAVAPIVEPVVAEIVVVVDAEPDAVLAPFAEPEVVEVPDPVAIVADEIDDVEIDDVDIDELEPVELSTLVLSPTEAVVALDTPTSYLMRLEQVRAEMNDLGARRRRPRGRRRLEDARREERELLDKLGFDSYLDLMLTNAGTRQSESSPAPSGLENGDLDGNGGGGGSSDIGMGGSVVGVAAPVADEVPWAPDASDEPENADQSARGDDPVVDDVDAVEPGDDGVEPASPFTSGAPTIADWLASPLAPPIAASSSVDVGA